MLLLVSVISCKKQKGEISAASVEGTWELRHVEGLQVAGMDPNFKAGNGNLLIFKDNILQKFSDGKLVKSTAFTIKPEKVKVNNTTSEASITYDNKDKDYLSVSGNKLILFVGQIAADGVEQTYEKIAPLPQ